MARGNGDYNPTQKSKSEMIVGATKNPDGSMDYSRTATMNVGDNKKSELPGTLSASELAAAKERMSKVVILDKKGLEAARAKAKVELGASDERDQGRTGSWDGRTGAEIKVLRDKHNLGDFRALYEIGIANLAKQELTRLDVGLEKLRVQGRANEGDRDYESLMQEREKYQEMLEATPPEARLTSLDSQLETEERAAWAKFNQLADKDQSTGISKFFEILTGPKQESSEVKAARKAWKSTKAKKEENEARKILQIAEVMDLPSYNDAEITTGQMIGEWRVAYIAADKSLVGKHKVILQKGEGQDSQLIMKNIGEIKSLALREKYLADHPQKRGEEDLS